VFFSVKMQSGDNNFAEIGVGSRTQDPNHLFSGARVVIAHKNKLVLSLNKNYTPKARTFGCFWSFSYYGVDCHLLMSRV